MYLACPRALSQSWINLSPDIFSKINILRARSIYEREEWRSVADQTNIYILATKQKILYSILKSLELSPTHLQKVH